MPIWRRFDGHDRQGYVLLQKSLASVTLDPWEQIGVGLVDWSGEATTFGLKLMGEELRPDAGADLVDADSSKPHRHDLERDHRNFPQPTVLGNHCHDNGWPRPFCLVQRFKPLGDAFRERTPKPVQRGAGFRRAWSVYFFHKESGLWLRLLGRLRRGPGLGFAWRCDGRHFGDPERRL